METANESLLTSQNNGEDAEEQQGTENRIDSSGAGLPVMGFKEAGRKPVAGTCFADLRVSGCAGDGIVRTVVRDQAGEIECPLVSVE
jgi:hypothetical protein